jgi:hypothetical protein
MAVLHGRARFPGIERVVSAEYTNSHGTEPGVALLVTAPQARPPSEFGTLVLTDGRVTISLPGAKVHKVTALTAEAGLIVWQVALLDRRWRWQQGAIEGHYNLRDRTGLLRAETVKTPQQLAAMLFQALGERSFDVGQLPNDARPQVDWELMPPAQALDELCERLGCRVILRLGSNTPAIVRLGVGSALPRADMLSVQAVADPPERPGALLYIGGPSRYQAQFALEPVGLDSDGKIRAIRDLSYRPAVPANALQTGWENSPRDFPNVAGEQENALARLSVFRWYRIKLVDPSTIKAHANAVAGEPIVIDEAFGSGLPSAPGNRFKQNAPNSFKVKSLDQVLPIEDQRLTPRINAAGVATDDYAASVTGWFTLPGLDGRMPDDVARYELPYTIDRERGIVVFRDYVTLRGRIGAPGQDKKRPALLWLTCAFSLTDRTTRALSRYARRVPLPGPSSGAQDAVIRRDEAVLQAAVVEGANGQFNLVTNQQELDLEAGYYLQAEASRYQTREAHEVPYMGFKAIELDGAIQQCTWALPPTTTRASRHSEHHPYIEPYRERRRTTIGRDVLDPEFLANVRRQLADVAASARRPLGPGLRGS